MTSRHMRSHILCTCCNQVFRGYGFRCSSFFYCSGRGIKVYDVDPRMLVPSLSVALQSKRGGYAANAVGLLVPSRRYGLGTAFSCHMEREAAQFVSALLSDPGLKATA